MLLMLATRSGCDDRQPPSVNHSLIDPATTRIKCAREGFLPTPFLFCCPLPAIVFPKNPGSSLRAIGQLGRTCSSEKLVSRYRHTRSDSTRAPITAS